MKEGTLDAHHHQPGGAMKTGGERVLRSFCNMARSTGEQAVREAWWGDGSPLRAMG